MENKQISAKAGRILYTVVVGAICLTALIVGIVAVANRPATTEPPIASGSGTTATAPNTTRPQNNPSDKPTGSEDEETVYLCPLSGCVSRRHDVENLYYSQSMGDWRTHAGIDIAAALGDAVTVAADGKVDEIWEDSLMGTCVSVQHGDGIVSVYKNLAPTLAEGVTVGSELQAGDRLGAVGESALCEMADEAHLHFEVLQDGVAVDPLSVLSEESCSASLTFKDEVYED